MWKRKPSGKPGDDNLEIVCAARDAVPTSGAMASSSGLSMRIPMQSAAPAPGPVVASTGLALNTAESASARGISYSENDSVTFLKACADGQVEVVLYALESNPELAKAVDSDSGHTAFMKAIRGKSLEILKALARLNPDAVNTGDKNSATPIHHAVVYQNVEAIRVLVGAGGDLQSKDKNNETPLDLAKKLVRRGTHKDDSVVEALESMVVS